MATVDTEVSESGSVHLPRAGEKAGRGVKWYHPGPNRLCGRRGGALSPARPMVQSNFALRGRMWELLPLWGGTGLCITHTPPRLASGMGHAGAGAPDGQPPGRFRGPRGHEPGRGGTEPGSVRGPRWPWGFCR
ncbi:unnamed protein product [Caretta caretta]